jgi:hypothetical protein
MKPATEEINSLMHAEDIAFRIQTAILLGTFLNSTLTAKEMMPDMQEGAVGHIFNNIIIAGIYMNPKEITENSHLALIEGVLVPVSTGTIYLPIKNK